ncbi:MAG TPA: hypothetical protein VHQ45_12205 [Gemmatimonadaceae bacterium]|nr:hypothetical protein [Gemmatimonadaceae bacterium]
MPLSSTVPPYPPSPPFPPAPQPGPRAPLQPPLVYVAPVWEYRKLTRPLGAETLPTEAELDALGAEGWELAAVVPEGARVHFYLKRLRE